MTTESLDKTKIKESIENIRKALHAYKEEVDKKNKKAISANNDHAAETRNAVIQTHGLLNDNSFAQNIKNLFEQAEEKLKALEDAVNSALGIDENTIRQILIPILEVKIKEIEQQVKAEYLPTYLHEIYEVIKTLLGKLIIWLSTPLPGEQQQVHQFAQTLSSTHSSVVYEFKNMEKTLFSRNTKDKNPASRGFVNEGMNEIESKLLQAISDMQGQMKKMQEQIDSIQGGSVEDNKQLTKRVETLERKDNEKAKTITSLERELVSVKTTANAAATQVAVDLLSGKVTAAEESLATKADQSDLIAGLEKKADKTTVDTLSVAVNHEKTGLAATAGIANAAATETALNKLSTKVGTVETTANAAATKEEHSKLSTTVDEVGKAVERIRDNFFYRMRDYGDAKKQEPNDTHGLGQAMHSQMEVLEAIADAVTDDKKAKVTEVIEKLRKQNSASFFDEAAWLSHTPYRNEESELREQEFLEKYPKPPKS